MNPFKPRRTFESVVRELVAGLEDGAIVLGKDAGTPPPEKRTDAIFLFSNSLGMRMKASPHPSRTKRCHRFVAEWVSLDLQSRQNLPLDFNSNQALKVFQVSR